MIQEIENMHTLTSVKLTLKSFIRIPIFFVLQISINQSAALYIQHRK